MTAELVSKLRKGHRRMLRSIYQAGRRRLITTVRDSESSNSGDGTASSTTEETLEPWSEWIKRV
eukprot:6619143-Karenia_brevis.AAC.1